MRTITFYLLITAPLLMLVMLAKLALINSVAFAGLLLLYVFVYHPTIVGKRLLAKHIITDSDFKKTYIPFWNQQFFKQAFFS